MVQNMSDFSLIFWWLFVICCFEFFDFFFALKFIFQTVFLTFVFSKVFKSFGKIKEDCKENQENSEEVK